MGKKILIGIGVLVVIGAIAGSKHNKSSSSSSSDSGSLVTDASTLSSSDSNKATADNTPHVGLGGDVIVDTLDWSILGSHTAKRIGDQYTGQIADGNYLVVRLSVNNGKSQSVTLSSDQAKLEANGNEYSADTNGLTALELSGAKTFFLKDLGPGVTTTGWVVFDVPPSVLSAGPEVCFHELGFGSTKGCIAVG